MTVEQHLQIYEEMGWEISEDQLPLDPAMLSLESQQALVVLQSLPDLWDGMSGSWLGKDYSGLGAIMDIYEIDNKKLVFELLKICEIELSKFYTQKKKEQESLKRVK